MDISRPRSVEPAREIAAEALRYGSGFLRHHGWRIALWFFCLVLPLWGFAALVGEVHENEVFAFDAPILKALHAIATPALDEFALVMTKLGYLWAVVPLDVVVMLWLAWHRRLRDGLFFGVAVTGSALLNVVAKNYFARARPDLWLSLAPETTYSFPSGHAMGSATLGVALVLLCWPTRWRWPVLAGAVGFVLLVGLSRIYLGVHYPSDILAGWAAAIAWVFGIHQLASREVAEPRAGVAPGDP